MTTTGDAGIPQDTANMNPKGKRALVTRRYIEINGKRKLQCKESSEKMVPAHQDVQTEGLDVKSGNESGGYYHTSFHIKHGKNEPKTKKGYVKTHATVKKLTGAKDAHARDYLDSKRGRHLVGKEADHGYIKKDFAKFSKTYKASDYKWESDRIGF